jgi:hypothetical protein
MNASRAALDAEYAGRMNAGMRLIGDPVKMKQDSPLRARRCGSRA